MIDESFVQSAIRIRREFLSIENHMGDYKRKASDVVKNLDYLKILTNYIDKDK